MVSMVQHFNLWWNDHCTMEVHVFFVFFEFQDLFSQQTASKLQIVFLKDVAFVYLRAIMDCVCRGEVSFSEDQLSYFLRTTDALKIRGELIVMHPSAWCVLNLDFSAGLADKQRKISQLGLLT